MIATGHVASALLEVSVVDGRSRCTVNQSAPPLTFRDTRVVHPTSSRARLTWVGTAAGPIGGDALDLILRVAPDAALVMDSAGASLVMPGPHEGRSSLDVTVDVGDRAALHWWPEPTVLVDGCDHAAVTRLEVGADARVVWCEELVLGRHDEPAGRATTRLVVDRVAGGERTPLLRTGLDVGGPGWSGPAGVGPDARFVAQVVTIGCRPTDIVAVPGVSAAVTTVAPDVSMLTVIARTAAPGRAHVLAAAPGPSAGDDASISS